MIAKRNRTSEYLCGTIVSQSSTCSRLSVTHLDHDHRESKNVRFLAMSPLVQDLRRSPSHSVTILGLGALDRTRVLSDRSEAEIRETRMTVGIHKDVWLYMYQCGGETKFK